MQTISSLYRVPHCKYHTQAVYTNNPYAGLVPRLRQPAGDLRGGSAHGQARRGDRHGRARVPPEERAGPGRGHAAGHALQDLRLQGLPATAAERSDFLRKQAENRARWSDPDPVKRGIGMASMLHVGGGAKIYPSDGCGTILKIDDFAHVTLMTGASEIGQGSETVLAQLVCEELGPAAVGGHGGQQRHRHHALGRGRARFAHDVHRRQLGDRRGAQGARRRSSPRRRRRPELPADALGLRGGCIVRRDTGERLFDLASSCAALHFSDKAELVMTTFLLRAAEPAPGQAVQGRRLRGLRLGDAGLRGRGGHARPASCACSRCTGAHDVGRVLNRLGIEGQIEGGIVMGQGYALTEDLMVEDGVIRNPNFRDYKLVTAPEIPEMDITFIETHGRRGAAGRQGRRRSAGDLHRGGGGERDLQRHRHAHLRAAVHAGARLPRAARGGKPPAWDAAREAAHRAQHGAGAVHAVRDAALRAARLARDPHRGAGLGQGAARRPEPLHRRARRGRRPAQLLHRAQRRQGGDRAQPQERRGPRRPEATGRGTGRRRVLLQHRARSLRAARHRLRDARRREAGPHLGRHLGARARSIPTCPATIR